MNKFNGCVLPITDLMIQPLSREESFLYYQMRHPSEINISPVKFHFSVTAFVETEATGEDVQDLLNSIEHQVNVLLGNTSLARRSSNLCELLDQERVKTYNLKEEIRLLKEKMAILHNAAKYQGNWWIRPAS